MKRNLGIPLCPNPFERERVGGVGIVRLLWLKGVVGRSGVAGGGFLGALTFLTIIRTDMVGTSTTSTIPFNFNTYKI